MRLPWPGIVITMPTITLSPTRIPADMWPGLLPVRLGQPLVVLLAVPFIMRTIEIVSIGANVAQRQEQGRLQVD